MRIVCLSMVLALCVIVLPNSAQATADAENNPQLAEINLVAEQTEVNTLLVEPKDKAGKAQAAATLNDPPNDVNSNGSSGGLQEIIVTAQKRAERLIERPDQPDRRWV